LPQGEGHTPGILGGEGDESLLGGVTPEILGLIFHPVNRTLQSARGGRMLLVGMEIE